MSLPTRHAGIPLLLAMVLALAWARPVAAAPLLWSVEASFVCASPRGFGCNTPPQITLLSGSFRHDAATGDYSDWNLSFGGFAITGADWAPVTTSPTLLRLRRTRVTGDPGSLDDAWSVDVTTLGLFFASPLTEAGGTVGLTASSGLKSEITFFDPPSPPNVIVDLLFLDDLVSGQVSATAPPTGVPAPATLAWLVPACSLLGLLRSRRA